jgi:hypothetical protein
MHMSAASEEGQGPCRAVEPMVMLNMSAVILVKSINIHSFLKVA